MVLHKPSCHDTKEDEDLAMSMLTLAEAFWSFMSFHFSQTHVAYL